MKKVAVIGAGDAAINLTTTSGNITIDAQGNETDIIFNFLQNSPSPVNLIINNFSSSRRLFIFRSLCWLIKLNLIKIIR